MSVLYGNDLAEARDCAEALPVELRCAPLDAEAALVALLDRLSTATSLADVNVAAGIAIHELLGIDA